MEAPKVGTKFRWIGGETRFYTQGNTYSVTTEVGASGLFSIDDNVGPHWWDTRSMEGKFVEVVGSPIRTRREIVPGVYGIVRVSVTAGCIDIDVEHDGLTAEQAREASHLLAQIAEVLEESA